MNGYAKKAIILARVSTEEQAKDGHYSIPAQLRNLRAYVDKGGKFETIKKVIAEHQFNESATRDKRKKFEEAIEIVNTATEPIAIITDKVDRLQRSFRESVRFDKLRKEGKIELHFVNDGPLVIHKNSRAHELLMWDAFVMFARAYVTQLSENVKRGNLEKLRRGEPLGYVPTGYKNVTKEIAKGKITKEIAVDVEKSPYVIRCFKVYASGNYSLEGLADTMRKEGFSIKAKRKRVNGSLMNAEPREITKTDILGMLQNPFYYGEFYCEHPEKGERALWSNRGEDRDLEPTYDPLITKKLFDTVQVALDKKNSRANGFGKNDFKFKGLITCGYCGCLMTGEEMSRSYKNKKAKRAKTIYYHCTNGKRVMNPSYYEEKYPEWAKEWRKKSANHSEETKAKRTCPCPQRWWDEEEIEGFILVNLGITHHDEDTFKALKKALEEDYEMRTESVDSQLKGLRAQKGEGEKVIKNIRKSIAVEEDAELKQEWRQDYYALKEKQGELDNHIRLLEETKDLDTDEIMETLSMCTDLKEQYEKLEPKRQRELLLWCFSNIEAKKGLKLVADKRSEFTGMEFMWNEPFKTFYEDKIFEEFKKLEEELAHITKPKENKASPFP